MMIWDFIDDNKLIFSVVFAAIGLFVTFFGKKFMKATLFIAGFVLVFFAVMAVAFGFFVKSDTPDTAKWIILACAIILGNIMGIAISRETAQKIGFFILGTLLGVMLGAFLYQTVLVRMDVSEDHGDAVNITSMVLCGL